MDELLFPDFLSLTGSRVDVGNLVEEVKYENQRLQILGW